MKVRAVRPFLARVPGRGRVRVTLGSVYDETDTVVAGRESHFVAVPEDAVVEQATAAPGEKRVTRKRDKDVVGGE